MTIIERVKRSLSRSKKTKDNVDRRDDHPIEDDRLLFSKFADWRRRRLDYLTSIGDTTTAEKEGLI